MNTASIKQHDNLRAVNDTLTMDGAVINLTGCTVKLLLKNAETRAVTEKAATIVLAIAGTVTATLTATDTAQAGRFEIEWQVTFAGGAVMTVPDDGYRELVILPDLNAT